MNQLSSAMVRAFVEAIKRASTHLPPDVRQALRKAYEIETSPAAKAQLEAILRNIELAERLGVPLCQDTGIVTFYVRVGLGFPGVAHIEKALVEAVREATSTVPLRPNSVDPVTGLNTGDNTGRSVPIIIWDAVDPDSSTLEVTVALRGGGSEYTTVFSVLPPWKGLEGVKELVLEAVIRAGAMPCPPTVIGVGIGGTAEYSMLLAKKAATIRRIGTRHPNPVVAELEEELLEMVNELGVGAMGVGGKVTALALHIDYAHRHPAAYPIAIAFQCWALRRATARVHPSGDYVIEQ